MSNQHSFLETHSSILVRIKYILLVVFILFFVKIAGTLFFVYQNELTVRFPLILLVNFVHLYWIFQFVRNIEIVSLLLNLAILLFFLRYMTLIKLKYKFLYIINIFLSINIVIYLGIYGLIFAREVLANVLNSPLAGINTNFFENLTKIFLLIILFFNIASLFLFKSLHDENGAASCNAHEAISRG